MNKNEEIILEKICKKCKVHEKVIVTLFKKVCIKCYYKGRVDTFNNINI